MQHRFIVFDFLLPARQYLAEAVHSAVSSLHNPAMHFKIRRSDGIRFLFPRLDMRLITAAIQICLQPFCFIAFIHAQVTALLLRSGFKANSYAGVIEVGDSIVASVQQALKEILLSGLPSEFELAADVPDKYLDKYDEYLPESLLAKGYGAKAFDVEGTRTWLQENLQ